MFSKIGAKIALRKAGIPSSTLTLPDTSSLFGSSTRDATVPSPFSNILSSFQVPEALKTWKTPPPPPIEIAGPPIHGTRAPACLKLGLPLKDSSRRPSIVVFLRHCGCPFAEKTFLTLRNLANKYPSISCIAVSHCSNQATEKWLDSIGGKWAVKIIIDEEREVYAKWGLGVSSTYHLLNPWTQVALRKLGTAEGIWAREADPTGNRWVVGGAWCTDELGIIKWGEANKTADDIPKFSDAIQCIGIE